MHLQELLFRLQSHPWMVGDSGIWGMALFTLVAALSQAVLFPITPFAITAGFVFGFKNALLVMLVTKMLAATLNFTLTRFLGRAQTQWLSHKFPFFFHLNASLEKEGLRLAILLRLCPFPFAVASYGYGLTRLAFRYYLVATFVGILAPTLIFVGVGTSARSGLESLNQAGASKSPWESTLFAVGLVASILVTRRITKMARQKISESTSPSSANTQG